MKKLVIFLSVCLALIIVIPALAAETTENELPENEINWNFDENGCLTISGSGVLTDSNEWEELKPQIKEIVVEDGISKIGYGVFSGCSELTSITLPFIGSEADKKDSYESQFGYIFGGAYYENSKTYYQITANNYVRTYYFPITLKNVSVNADSIPPYAFYNCPFLETVTIGDKVLDFGYNAFYNCKELKAVYITDLKNWCESNFENTVANPLAYARTLYVNGKKADIVSIPDETEFISKYAFYNASCITGLTLPSGIKYIDDYAFAYCEKIVRLKTDEGIDSIGENAFAKCIELNEVHIPSGIHTIKADAFLDCNQLNSVYTTDITEWCNIIFENASSNPLYYAKNLYIDKTPVTSIIIDSRAENINNYAFYNAQTITDVRIDAEIERIGNYAFAGCSSLKDITVPETLKEIGDSAFYGCQSLNSLIVPDCLNQIGKYAFYNCKKLTATVFTPNLTEIGDYTYYGCSSLSEVTIPEGITVIRQRAFCDCTSVKELTVPSTVTRIEVYAFSNMVNLEKLYWNVTETGNFIENNYCFSSAGKQSGGVEVFFGDTVYRIPDNLFNAAFLNSGKTIIRRYHFGKNIKMIGICAITSGVSPEFIEYAGTSDEWEDILIYSKNEMLTEAKIHFSDCNHIVYDDYKPATCTEKGHAPGIYCPRYDEMYYGFEEYPTLQHTYDAGQITDKPTRQKSGTLRFSCINCDAFYEIPLSYTDYRTKYFGFFPADVDNDGDIDISDARTVLRYAIGLEVCRRGSATFYAADVNEDRMIKVDDARIILRVAIGLDFID